MPQAWLTVGLDEASHRDWLETQACCGMHQKQGHCVDRQLVHLEARGPSDTQLPTPPSNSAPSNCDPGGRFQLKKVFLIIGADRKGWARCRIVSSMLILQEVCKEDTGKRVL